MRFVEIVPPEAGKLDEHKALVELTAEDFGRLCAAMPERGHGRSAAQLELGAQLADALHQLIARRQLAETPGASQ